VTQRPPANNRSAGKATGGGRGPYNPAGVTVRRYLRAAVVIAAFIGSWGWLGWRQHRRFEADLGPRFARAVPGLRESFLGVYAGDDPIGVLYSTVEPETRHGRVGVTARLTGHLWLRLFDAPTSLRIGGQVWYAPNPPVAELHGHLEAEHQRLAVRGRAEGGTLEGEIESAGQTMGFRVPFDAAQLDASALPLALPTAALEPGREVQVRTLDPLSLRPQVAHLRGLGSEEIEVLGAVRSACLAELDSQGATYRLWIGEDGELLQARTPFGLTLRALTRDEARKALRQGAPMDLVATTIVTPRGVPPHTGATRLLVRVSAAQAPPLPADENQVPADSNLWIIAPKPPAARTLPTPLPTEIAAFAQPELLVQSDHPRIRALAAEITHAAADDWDRVLRINRWVHEHLAKRLVASLPSALAVLDAREGDCNEHTVLAVALLRAAGLPARTAIGMVWSEEAGGFGYHAWPEVWLGHWVWTDPTYGQDVADATHLKLLAGGVERWPELVAFLGRIELEVKEVR